MSTRLSISLRIVGLVVVGVLLYVFARNMEWAVMWRALRRAELLPILLATAMYFVTLAGKAWMWRILLAPAHVVPLRRLVRYTIAAFAGSVLAPARAGEVLRIVALNKRDGVPVADAAGVALTDKLLHSVALLVLVAPLPWLLPDLPSWALDALLVCSGIAVGVLIAVYIAVGRIDTGTPQSWFGRLVAGMHAVREPGRLFASLGILAAVWAIDMLTIFTVLRSVDVDVSFAQCLFILFSINLAVAIPATPANLGTLQLGALVALKLLGVPSEPAMAFALLYHAIQIFPLLIVAFALEFRLVIPAGARGKLAA